MSDFELYEKTFSEYKKIKEKKISDEEEEIKVKNKEEYCSHENTTSERGVYVCIDCGEEIQQKISNEKEWRYYGKSDNRYSSDPTRVQIRKVEEKSIFKDISGLGLSDDIIEKADAIYNQVADGKISRGNSRKATIFAAVWHAYKISGQHQDLEDLKRLFNLNTKAASKGVKQVSLSVPKDSDIRKSYVTPINMIENIMDDFSATKEQKKEAIEIYNRVRNRSSQLNRSRPNSIAYSIVYYWIKLKNIDISLKQYAQKVALSELTITKIAKEIATVLKTPDLI